MKRARLRAELNYEMGIHSLYLMRGLTLVAVIIDEDLEYLTQLMEAINDLADSTGR